MPTLAESLAQSNQNQQEKLVQNEAQTLFSQSGFAQNLTTFLSSYDDTTTLGGLFGGHLASLDVEVTKKFIQLLVKEIKNTNARGANLELKGVVSNVGEVTIETRYHNKTLRFEIKDENKTDQGWDYDAFVDPTTFQLIDWFKNLKLVKNVTDQQKEAHFAQILSANSSGWQAQVINTFNNLQPWQNPHPQNGVKIGDILGGILGDDLLRQFTKYAKNDFDNFQIQLWKAIASNGLEIHIRPTGGGPSNPVNNVQPKNRRLCLSLDSVRGSDNPDGGTLDIDSLFDSRVFLRKKLKPLLPKRSRLENSHNRDPERENDNTWWFEAKEDFNLFIEKHFSEICVGYLNNLAREDINNIHFGPGVLWMNELQNSTFKIYNNTSGETNKTGLWQLLHNSARRRDLFWSIQIPSLNNKTLYETGMGFFNLYVAKGLNLPPFGTEFDSGMADTLESMFNPRYNPGDDESILFKEHVMPTITKVLLPLLEKKGTDRASVIKSFKKADFSEFKFKLNI